MQHLPIFDGHNDVLTRIYRSGANPVDEFTSVGPGHIYTDTARAGGLGGGFFAVWVPSPVNLDDLTEEMSKEAYDLPLPEPISWSDATAVAMAQIADLSTLEAAGVLEIVTTADRLEACLAEGTFAAILHMEGAEAIDPELRSLEVFYRAGLRSLGPVWSRNTVFAEGVPFRFPAMPQAGAGLTPAGKRLVQACNDMGIMIDLSHLNEAGFWDVAELSSAPLVATHSNAHAICQHARNLTDAQLDRIGESDGLVGLNFAAAFLRPDGKMDADVPMEHLLSHLDHLLDRLGEDRVGLGSDFDGAVVPQEIGDAAGLPVLREAMKSHGYSIELVEKICWRNWVRVLRQTWKG
ncbi:MAG: dipeptidase [Pseudomonadota bacterium]